MTEHHQQLTALAVMQATGGTLLHGDASMSFAGVSTDSRSIGPGEIFIALKGDRFDGHTFIRDSVSKGATGVVADHEVDRLTTDSVAYIRVRDTLTALGDLARWWRVQHPVPLAAVVGSNGKTTTKEMTAHILSQRHSVLKNEQNLNNLIGLPLSLLRMHSGHEVGVVELGMNQRGEIQRLTQIARPDLAVLTNIAPVHLEGLTSLNGIALAKGEILAEMGDRGHVIYNADDPRIAAMAESFSGGKTSYGVREKADWTTGNRRRGTHGTTTFELQSPEGSTSITLSVIGSYQAYNALAASAAGFHMGATLHDIATGLRSFSPLPLRMELVNLAHNVQILNDTYNANPVSMKAALETLRDATAGRKIACLGDMAELGAYAPEAHQDIGRWAAECDVDMLFVLGTFAHHVTDGAAAAGMDPVLIICPNSTAELTEQLAQRLRPGDLILIKGSRTMHMEDIVERIKGRT